MKYFLKTLLFLLILAYVHPAEATIPDSLKSRIANTIAEFETTGLALAIVKDGQVIYQKAFGYQNQDQNKKLKTNHLFNIASCTKAFTGAAISKLVNEGKLQWEDKVIDYITGFQLANPCISNMMTIEDLLTHRSGLGTFYGDLLWYQTDYSNSEIIERLRYLPLNNNFRSEYGYQNNMYMVAGEIIEKVSGKSWTNYILEQFLQPLQMNQTFPSNDEMPNQDLLAAPHIDGTAYPLYDWEGTKAAASIHSNVENMTNWLLMWLNEGNFNDQQILSREMIEDVWTPKTILPVSRGQRELGTNFSTYGLGWQIFDYHGIRIIEHDGGMPGYISKVTLIPEYNLGLVILNNGMDYYVNNTIRNQIVDHYRGKTEHNWEEFYLSRKNRYNTYLERQDSSRRAARIENTSLSRKPELYAGIYEDKMYGRAEVKFIDEKLHLTLLPADDVFNSSMEHWHFDTFKVEFKDPFLPFGLINFDLDSSGKPQGFTIDLPNFDFHFHNLDFKKIKS